MGYDTRSRVGALNSPCVLCSCRARTSGKDPLSPKQHGTSLSHLTPKNIISAALHHGTAHSTEEEPALNANPLFNASPSMAYYGGWPEGAMDEDEE